MMGSGNIATEKFVSCPAGGETSVNHVFRKKAE
jgi:hypothetical protein